MSNSKTTSSPLSPPSSGGDTFHTENLELASFLMARGHKLSGSIPDGRLVLFGFAHAAEQDVPNFFSGAIPVPPITLFEHHRTLRSLITTIRNTRNRRAGGVE